MESMSDRKSLKRDVVEKSDSERQYDCWRGNLV